MSSLGLNSEHFIKEKKGRDLFDLYRLSKVNMINPHKTIEALLAYLQKQGLQVKREQYLDNLKLKLSEPVFRADVKALLISGVEFDPDLAF